MPYCFAVIRREIHSFMHVCMQFIHHNLLENEHFSPTPWLGIATNAKKVNVWLFI